MLRIRKMLPGETRTYNTAHFVNRSGETQVLREHDGTSDFIVILVGEDTIIESVRPCRVRYSKPKGDQ